MYIPIGPSKKQLYKIVILLLLLIYLLFLGMYKPKAQVIDLSITIGQSGVTGSFTNDFTLGNNLFYNVGQGKIIYQFLATGQMNINSISLDYHQSSKTNSICQFGTVSNYNDSPNQQVFYSIVCDVDLTNAGIDNLIIKGYAWQTSIIDFSGYLQFTNLDTQNDTNQILQNIDDKLLNNNTWNNYIYDNIVDMKSYIQSLISSINNGNQTQQNIQNNTQNISNNLNDSSIDSSSANDFTSNSAFQDSNGLDSIIKAPLNFIQSLTSSTCSAISLTIPYIDAQVSLPCMSTIYTKALGQQLVNLIALVINGVVLYRYCLKILQIVKDAKNPNKDGLEVLDL